VIRGEIKGLDKLRKNFKNLEKQVPAELKGAMFDATNIVRSDAIKNAPSGASPSGEKIKNNIVAIVESAFKGVVGVKDRIRHARPVEFGSRPHFPPIQALTGREEPLDRWVRLKLGAGPGAAYAIARKIARRGTKAQPYLIPAFKDNKRRIIKLFDKAINRAIK
jgi:HK97 gp10 family phage protein